MQIIQQVTAQLTYKTLMLGQSDVGKTAIIDRMLDKEFKEEKRVSEQMQVDVRAIELLSGKVRLEVWDASSETLTRQGSESEVVREVMEGA